MVKGLEQRKGGSERDNIKMIDYERQKHTYGYGNVHTHMAVSPTMEE